MKKKKKAPRLTDYEEPIYSEMKNYTLRDFTNRFLTPLFFFFLIFSLVIIIILRSLGLIIVVILSLLFNAIYVGIQKRSDKGGIGDWNCTNIMRRLFYGIIFPSYIIFLWFAFFLVCGYYGSEWQWVKYMTRNYGNLFPSTFHSMPYLFKSQPPL